MEGSGKKWNDCVNGWLFSDRKETRKAKVRWRREREKNEQGREEAWVRGKWMRQEETRECVEVGSWKQKNKNGGERKEIEEE